MNIASPSRILLAAISGKSVRDIEVLIEKAGRARYRTVGADELESALNEEDPDVVVLEIETLGERETAVLNEIRAIAPETALIVTSEALSPSDMRALLRFNLHDWLANPLEDDEFVTSLQRAVRAGKTNRNRVHAVISSVGGAGATTVAISMADIAAQGFFKRKQDVALFDLDFSLGNCAHMLNMVSSFNMGHVAANPSRIDSEFISVIRREHDMGFSLYSFKLPTLNTEMNGYEMVLRLLDAVSMEHDHTILDIPYYETEWKDDVIAAVNTVTIVTELNLASIKHAIDLIERIRDVRGKTFPIHVVINKTEGSLFGPRIGKKRLEELFEKVPFTFLPADNSLFGEAVDRGVAPSEVSKRAKFLKDLRKYMRDLEMEEKPA